MRLTYDVTALVEALHISGETAYTFHGGLSLEGSGNEPLQMAFMVPEAMWRDTSPGETLVFEFMDRQPTERSGDTPLTAV